MGFSSVDNCTKGSRIVMRVNGKECFRQRKSMFSDNFSKKSKRDVSSFVFYVDKEKYADSNNLEVNSFQRIIVTGQLYIVKRT